MERDVGNLGSGPVGGGPNRPRRAKGVAVGLTPVKDVGVTWTQRGNPRQQVSADGGHIRAVACAILIDKVTTHWNELEFLQASRFAQLDSHDHMECLRVN